MRTSELDRRVTLRRSTPTKDKYNADVVSWSDLATVWAAKTEIRDSERVEAAKVGATLTSRFRIRWSPAVADLNPKDQLVDGGRVHGIHAVKEIGRRDELEITATAQVD